ncbi:MAG: hypothetical protein ACTSPB_06465 [Candidatus Thorarchaeota archaeon]
MKKKKEPKDYSDYKIVKYRMEKDGFLAIEGSKVTPSEWKQGYLCHLAYSTEEKEIHDVLITRKGLERLKDQIQFVLDTSE